MSLQVVVSREGKVLARGVFRDQPVSIGRDEDNVIQIDAPAFSRHHARLEPQEGGGWIVRDLGSTNGVRKDGARVAEWTINDGDEVAIGDYRLTFGLDEEVGPAPSALLAGLPEHAVLGATFVTASAPGADHDQRERSSNLRGLLEEVAAPGRAWLVELDAFVIGADADADLRVGGLLAPRVGAVLVRGHGGFSIVNMSGRDAWVQVDGQPVPASAQLRAAALVEVGGHPLTFSIGAPAAGIDAIGQQSRARRPS
ncbi:MAG: FHA domain-containing protein [Planctomycetes bacterium]|nr:FHA domain-containing protein [Planctomycetota bacterium]